jgi:hypothetical protein
MLSTLPVRVRLLPSWRAPITGEACVPPPIARRISHIALKYSTGSRLCSPSSTSRVMGRMMPLATWFSSASPTPWM